ncbi:hypothetical protein BJ508DRAFT_14374 [Ascobolus immersus RN42]|uniref:Uncharacterized protein n=1 Tax=Ascobolus immersus RN42 TaxID=1160509 RepID=A0A3N4IIG1_ASCIM|nr:hypothetical protein BJ508DRAFT_14374 [Ascobolus immersus RN42]
MAEARLLDIQHPPPVSPISSPQASTGEAPTPATTTLGSPLSLQSTGNTPTTTPHASTPPLPNNPKLHHPVKGQLVLPQLRPQEQAHTPIQQELRPSPLRRLALITDQQVAHQERLQKPLRTPSRPAQPQSPPLRLPLIRNPPVLRQLLLPKERRIPSPPEVHPIIPQPAHQKPPSHRQSSGEAAPEVVRDRLTTGHGALVLPQSAGRPLIRRRTEL